MVKVLITKTVAEDTYTYPECPFAGRTIDTGKGWIVTPCNHPHRTQLYCASSHIEPVNCPF